MISRLLFVGFFEADQKLSKLEIEHKSLILAQIERWRHALHMQVGRQRGSACITAGEWRTGEYNIGTYRVMGDNYPKGWLIPHTS